MRRETHWQWSKVYLVIFPTEHLTVCIVCLCVGGVTVYDWDIKAKTQVFIAKRIHNYEQFFLVFHLLFISVFIYLIHPIPPYVWVSCKTFLNTCYILGKCWKRIDQLMFLSFFFFFIKTQCAHQMYFTFLKSRVQSLAFSPNCHLHCVSASYISPGSFSGYRYSLTALGSSDRQKAWAVLVVRNDKSKSKPIKEKIGAQKQHMNKQKRWL